MTFRVLASGFVALGIVATAMAADAWAGMGGRFAAPAAARGVWHSPAALSSARVLPSRQVGNVFHANEFRFSQLQHQHGFMKGRGFPFWWGAGGGGPYYYPTEPYYYPPENLSAYGYPDISYPTESTERRRPYPLYEPGCRTETQKVQSEAGGEHTINITRCY
jgi:hypothetical protein